MTKLKTIYTEEVKDTYFDKIDNGTKAFWLGFICADGCIKYCRKSGVLVILQKDDILLRQLAKDIGHDREIKQVYRKGSYADTPLYELRIYGNKLVETLLSAGKTRYKHDLLAIPNTIPEILIMDFIRGYFEGDGSISYNIANHSWMCRFSGNKDMLESIKSYFNDGGSIGKDKSISSLAYNGNEICKRIMGIMYHDLAVYGIKRFKYYEEVV